MSICSPLEDTILLEVGTAGTIHVSDGNFSAQRNGILDILLRNLG